VRYQYKLRSRFKLDISYQQTRYDNSSIEKKSWLLGSRISGHGVHLVVHILRARRECVKGKKEECEGCEDRISEDVCFRSTRSLGAISGMQARIERYSLAHSRSRI
jgi:hypothetical protein